MGVNFYGVWPSYFDYLSLNFKKFFFKGFILLFVPVFIPHMCLLGLLELGLNMVVHHNMGARNGTPDLYKSSQCLEELSL